MTRFVSSQDRREAEQPMYVVLTSEDILETDDIEKAQGWIDEYGPEVIDHNLPRDVPRPEREEL